MVSTMVTLANNEALLLFRVGPVLCCAPTAPVVAIVQPTPLHHPPGSTAASPGIFKHGGHIVSTRDLRVIFGIDSPQEQKSARLIVTQQADHQLGFFVDEILEVMSPPQSGFGPLPAMIPRGVFSRTLLLEKRIFLYSEFNLLAKLTGSGYLREYLVQLQAQIPLAKPQVATATNTISSPQHTTPQPAVANYTVASRPATAPVVVPARPAIIQITSKPNEPKKGTAPVFALQNKPDKVAAVPVSQSVTRKITPPVVSRRSTLPGSHGNTATGSIRNQASENRPLSPVPVPIDNHTKPTTRVSPRPSGRSNIAVSLAAMLMLVGVSGMALWWWLATTSLALTPVQENTSNSTPQSVVIAHPVQMTTEVNAANTIETTNTTYLATITREPDGITIILDSPANEPALTPTVTQPDIPAVPPPTPPLEITHIVVKGDTLWHIAKRYVNNPYRYPELARLSNIANPDLIYPGNRVRIIQRR